GSRFVNMDFKAKTVKRQGLFNQFLLEELSGSRIVNMNFKAKTDKWQGLSNQFLLEKLRFDKIPSFT
ncbi:6406_t:CDS:2, partial [Dentiscutata heterogama]